MTAAGRIRADFDRLAALADDGWDHNAHYHPFLLRRVPPGCRAALEVGCGSGAFARLLAGRADTVLALDLSPQMVRLARARLAGLPGAEARAADFVEEELLPASFDCVASIATLHHLPLEGTLARTAALLRPGGVLLVLDLYRAAAGLLPGPAARSGGSRRRPRGRPPSPPGPLSHEGRGGERQPCLRRLADARTSPVYTDPVSPRAAFRHPPPVPCEHA